MASTMRSFTVTLALCVIALLGSAAAQSMRRVVYATNWAQFQGSSSVGGKKCKWQPKDLPADLATHVVLAYAYIGSDFFLKTTQSNDLSLYSQTQDLKKHNPSLKTLIAIGGWTFSDPGTSQSIWGDMVASPENRAAFIRGVLNFTATYGWDGVTLDWEWPGQSDRGGRSTDKAGLVALVTELRFAATAGGRPSFLISITTSACPYGCSGLDFSSLLPSVDWFDMQTYSYAGSWDKTTGLMAPWDNAKGGSDIAETLSYFSKKKIPFSKLNLGVALYGSAWTLQNGTAGLGAAAVTNKAPSGACTKEPGTLAWYEIQPLIAQGASVTVDAVAKTAYLQLNSTFVSFDTPDTLAMKVDAAKAAGLGGFMVWEASQDDKKYTLLTTLKARAEGQQTSPSPKPRKSPKAAPSPMPSPTVAPVSGPAAAPMPAMQENSTGASPEPRSSKQYALQLVLSSNRTRPSQITLAQGSRIKAWLSPFASVKPADISTAGTTANSLVLSWNSDRTAKEMATRAQNRFNTTQCPYPAILNQARQAEAILGGHRFQVSGFNLLTSNTSTTTYALAAVNCAQWGTNQTAGVTVQDVAKAALDAQKLLADATKAPAAKVPSAKVPHH